MTIVVCFNVGLTGAVMVADSRLSYPGGRVRDVCQKIFPPTDRSLLGFAGDLCLALPGYPAWRAERNASRLREHYAAAAAMCDEWLVRQRWITQPVVFRAAGIPESHANFCSNAGIRHLIKTALTIQGRRYPGNRPLRPEDRPRGRGVVAHRRSAAVAEWARLAASRT